MNKKSDNSNLFSSLSLANGVKFLLRPTDPLSAEVVARFTKVMQLSPGSEGSEIFICVSDKIVQGIKPQEMRPLICSLSCGMGELTIPNQMSQLARFIATQIIPSGGMLIHGGLIMHQGLGVILAAEGGVGKSTACSRLLKSWDVLSDDATLVVETNEGSYYAHPWPTWSRFLEGESKETWNVEQAIPLSSIFFLQQSPVDQVTQLSRGDATAFIMESIRQVMLFPLICNHYSGRMDDPLPMCLSSAERLINSVPSHILQISLKGAFWEEISKTLIKPDLYHSSNKRKMSSPPINDVYRFFDEQSIPIIYSGPSMDPTFRDADLLEVVPYGTRPCRVGDVICFFSHEKEKHIIHRIISIHTHGVQTKGDNNSLPDPDLINPDEIIGKVKTVSRLSGTRTVTGGTPGLIIHKLLQARRSIWRNFYPFIHHLKKIPNPLGLYFPFIWRIISGFIEPHYILFSTRYNQNLKLYLGNYVAGEYHMYGKEWKIRFPFSLLIDKKNLPIIEALI